ncbi:MAG: hypothetical protein Q8N74_07390 [Sulfuricella sp.]|nr:hypothetical protein [Sulfuricella sp.]
MIGVDRQVEGGGVVEPFLENFPDKPGSAVTDAGNFLTRIIQADLAFMRDPLGTGFRGGDNPKNRS